MSIIKITTKEQFDLFMKSKQSGIIKYTANWCRPCKMIAPLYAELAINYPNISFFEVDLETEAGKVCQISSIPTFHFLIDGEIVDDVTGGDPQRVIELTQQLSSKLV